MAMILPAVGAWPIVAPEGAIEPGMEHSDTQAQQLIEGHNYLSGYHLLGHGASHWPGRGTVPAVTPGVMETAAGVLTVVGSFLVIPRDGVRGLRAYYRLDSDGGLEIRLTCVEDATTTGVMGYGAGPLYSFDSLIYAPPPATRGETLTTIQVELRALGTWAAIYELTPRDADLTAATLP